MADDLKNKRNKEDAEREQETRGQRYTGGDFAGYLEYRLGEAKAAEIRTALAAIADQLEHEQARAGVRAAFVAMCHEE